MTGKWRKTKKNNKIYVQKLTDRKNKKYRLQNGQKRFKKFVIIKILDNFTIPNTKLT